MPAACVLWTLSERDGYGRVSLRYRAKVSVYLVSGASFLYSSYDLVTIREHKLN